MLRRNAMDGQEALCRCGAPSATFRFGIEVENELFRGEAPMKSWLMAALLLFVASGAWADCPTVITAKSGLPGRFGEWTTTYDMRNGTFEARHATGNIISGSVRGTCTDRALVLEEYNTSNQNDGTCQLNRDGAKRFSGKCLPRGFDMRVNGF
jgi:hypothetical protein